MSLEIRQSLGRGAASDPDGGFALDVDLELPATGTTVLFGRSGSGKTTLLRCLAGLEPAARGRVRVGPRTWQDSARGIRLAPEDRRVGFVFQHGELFAHLDVRGNLEFGHRRRSEPERRIGLDEVVDLLELERLLPRRTAGLSGGERQRVALGRALLGSPSVLLLDEPLASLDRTARHQILPFLEALPGRFDLPILYVTHFMNEAARLADHLVLLEDGKVRRAGDLAAMLTDAASPLTSEPDAGAVLTATVTGIDAEDHLARLDLGNGGGGEGGELLIPDPELGIGRSLRVRVQARDVSLALERARETSILNVLPARILDLHPRGPGHTLVRLDLGGQVLLAAITRRSAAALELVPDRRVYAQIKSVALL